MSFLMLPLSNPHSYPLISCLASNASYQLGYCNSIIIISNASYQLGRLVVVVVPAPRRPPPRAAWAQSVPGDGGGKTLPRHGDTCDHSEPLDTAHQPDPAQRRSLHSAVTSDASTGPVSDD